MKLALITIHSSEASFFFYYLKNVLALHLYLSSFANCLVHIKKMIHNRTTNAKLAIFNSFHMVYIYLMHI